MDELTKVRLDKWLWAARFYKTRALAADAIDGGKVQVNGERAKRAKMVQTGDEVRIRNGPYEQFVHVTALSERRGPASVAATLYQETAASRDARAAVAAHVKAMQIQTRYDTGRPSKRDRRQIEAFRRRGDA
jgi:ribosome-associated heat shock protein Hsp15